MPYSGVFVFGDSLVDAGNALKLAQFYGTLTFSDLPDGAPSASRGYFQGRFSDGYTFDDLISNKAIGVVTRPVFPYGYEDPWIGIPIDPFAPDPSGHNLNFAYGGAQIRQGDEVVSDLDGQTDAFKDAVDGHADPNALYVVTIGGNDVRSLAPNGTDPALQSDAYAALAKAANTLFTELRGLVNVGVHNILLTGIPDVGVIPNYDVNHNLQLDGAEIARSAAATDYSRYLDTLIRTTVIPQLQALGANVTYAPMMDYTAASGQHVTGALNAIMPTIAALNGLTTQQLSQNLLQYQDLIFFDDIHPNAQTHALMAAYANAQLTGQPWVETTPLTGAEVDYRATGSIAVAGEVDKLVIAMVPATTYTFQMLGVSTLTSYVLGQLGVTSLGSGALLADASLKLMSASGAVLATDDDSGIGLDASLSFTNGVLGSYTLAFSAVGTLTGQYVITGTVNGAAMQMANTYTVTNASTLVIEGVGGVGIDVVQASVNYGLTPGSEIEVLSTTNDKGRGAINLTGNEFGQTIIGNAGSNVIDGKGGADALYGGKGNDTFVLGPDALASPANIDSINDYAVGDLVDLSQVLKVATGTNIVAGGYVRVTTSGFIQVDVDGGANNWVTLSSVNGSDPLAIRYLSGGVASTVSVGRTAVTALTTLSASKEAAGGTFDLWSQSRPLDDHHSHGQLLGFHAFEAPLELLFTAPHDVGLFA